MDVSKAPSMGLRPAGLSTSGVADAPASMPDQDANIDWSSIEEVASHVSRATLAGMQQLWKQHAGHMDTQGKDFAQRVYGLHSSAMKDIASMRTFELKPMMALLNSFTAGVRETVLEVFQQLRKQDDDFAQQMYQATRRNFTQNLKEALDARDAWYHEKIKGLKALHEATLQAARASAAVELKQQAAAHAAELSRAVAREQHRRLNKSAKTAILAAAAAAAAAAGNGSLGSGEVQELMRQASRASVSFMPNENAAEDEEDEEGDDDFARELAGSFRHLPSDVRSTDAAVAEARALVDELRVKVDSLTIQLQSETEEVATWRSKWAQESTKTDGIKRECLQIITKAEEHVKGLQQKHLAELSQRDYILQRCKDTILNLEARVTEVTGSPPVEAADIQHLLHLQRAPTPPGGRRSGPGSVAAALAAVAVPSPLHVVQPQHLVQVPDRYGPGWSPESSVSLGGVGGTP